MPRRSPDVTLAAGRFALPAQGARDIRGYEVMTDIARTERIVTAGVTDNRAVATVTNDLSYWTRPGLGRTAGAASFRRCEGERISGVGAWGKASAGTQKDRNDPVELSGDYSLTWQDCSQVADRRGGRFRQVIVEIGCWLTATTYGGLRCQRRRGPSPNCATS